MGKPLHPATVHFPIAFLSLSYILDLTHTLHPHLPDRLQNLLPVSTDTTRLSYFLLSAGLLTMLLALLTGVREAVNLISKQGMWQSDPNGTNTTMRPKVKAMIAHAVFNDTVFAVSGWVWWCKRSNAARSLVGKFGVPAGDAAFVPRGWMVGVEGLALGLLLFSANIGGMLAYQFGIGFGAGSGGVKKVQ